MTATATGTVLVGSLFITADDTLVEGVTIDGGIDVAGSGNLTLKNLDVRPGLREDAISLFGSTGVLEDLRVSCGPESCIHATTSTIAIRSNRLTPRPATKRGVRSSTSKLQIEKLNVSGTRIAQLQAELSSDVTLRRSQFGATRGTAIIVIRGSNLVAEQVRTSTTGQTSLLAQTSTVVASDSFFGASAGQTLSISGAVVRLRNTRVVAGPRGAANMKAFGRLRGQLHLDGGSIAHGDTDGILGSASLLTASGTRFEGQPGGRNGYAISVRGPRSRVRLDNVNIIAPAGIGVELADGAHGSISGTISTPGKEGVRLQGALGVPVTLKDLTVENCMSGAAVSVIDSNDVRVSGSRFVGCGPAGVLAVRRSVVQVRDSVIKTFAKYGLAAFGGARMVVSSSTVSGRPWAVFSACADDSRVVDRGDNHFVGDRGDCP